MSSFFGLSSSMFDRLPDDLLWGRFADHAPKLRRVYKDARRIFPYLLVFRGKHSSKFCSTTYISISRESQHVMVRLNERVIIDYFFAFASLDYNTRLHSITAHFQGERIFVSMAYGLVPFEDCTLNGFDLLNTFEGNETMDYVHDTLVSHILK